MLAARSFPAAHVFADEVGRVEAIDRDRDIGACAEIERRDDREDVDDSAVAPVIAGELHRLDEQRKRYGHADCSCDGYVRIGVGPEELDAVLLDVPDGRVRGNRHLGEGHVAEQPSIRRLEPIAAKDAGKASGPRRREQSKSPPVDVDVVAGPKPSVNVATSSAETPAAIGNPNSAEPEQSEMSEGG